MMIKHPAVIVPPSYAGDGTMVQGWAILVYKCPFCGNPHLYNHSDGIDARHGLGGRAALCDTTKSFFLYEVDRRGNAKPELGAEQQATLPLGGSR